MMDNAHIRDFLTYYCDLPREPQYAVLLTGLWGSGKTWFIKDFTENHLVDSGRVLYLSLYGTQSFDDIESELFRLLHPVLGSKPARVLGRLARGVLKTSINFDWDSDGKSDGSVSGGIPADKLLERISLDSNRILVLDDLERCSVPIADLLGYVNQFVEHGGVKTILIANEAKLLNTETSGRQSYMRIKEKLIGRTFEVRPEVQRALEHFALDLPTSTAREVVRANFSSITRVYECSRYRNLRLVRHSLWDFDRLLQSIEPRALSSPALLADLLTVFLSYSLEVRSGALLPHEVKKLCAGWTPHFRKDKDEADPDQRFHEIRAKYSALQLYESLIQESVWEALFSTGSIPVTDLNQSLLASKYFQDENQPNWVKLWYGMNLSDEKFAAILTQVEHEWENRLYRNLGEVVHVTGLFIRFAIHGILNKTVDDVVDSAKAYVDELVETGAIPVLQPNSHPSLFDHDAYAGLGYTSMENDQFKLFLKYIDERRQMALQASFPSQAENLLILLENDINLFIRRLVLTNDSENIYYNTPILHLIKPKEFVKRLLAVTPDNRRTAAYTLKERYAIENFRVNLLPELPWLRDVADLLREEIINRSGKISSLSLNWIVDPYITDAIARLETSANSAS